MESNRIPVQVNNNAPSSHGSAKKTKAHRRALNKAKNDWKALAIILGVLLVVLLAYGYISTKHELNKLSDSKAASQNAATDLTGKVGKLVQLPTGETPTIATVNDVSKLNSQAFFKNAQNGDKVLIYTKANQAILYRPTTNKVIQFSSVNLGTNQ